MPLLRPTQRFCAMKIGLSSVGTTRELDIQSFRVKEGLGCVIFRAVVARKTPNSVSAAAGALATSFSAQHSRFLELLCPCRSGRGTAICHVTEVNKCPEQTYTTSQQRGRQDAKIGRAEGKRRRRRTGGGMARIHNSSI